MAVAPLDAEDANFNGRASRPGGTGKGACGFHIAPSDRPIVSIETPFLTVAPSQRRRSVIQALHVEASRLLAAARDEQSTLEIARAIVGLDEATHYLTEYDANNRVHILAIVDLSIQLAAHRLQGIAFPA